MEREDALIDEVPGPRKNRRGENLRRENRVAGKAASRATSPARENDDERFANGREDDEPESLDDDLDDDFLQIFRESMTQSVLPDLPKMDGYHVCWLSSTHARDTIQTRLRMGYELITPEMLPGWDSTTLRSVSVPGVIGVNEMVAARVPMRLYQRMMREVHHNMPLGEEEKLKARTDLLKQQAEQIGSVLSEGDGMSEVVQRAPTPRFAE